MLGVNPLSPAGALGCADGVLCRAELTSSHLCLLCWPVPLSVNVLQGSLTPSSRNVGLQLDILLPD